MKTGNKRTFLLTAVVFSILSPDLLVTVAQAQSKVLVINLLIHWVFLSPFAIMVVGGLRSSTTQLPFVAKLSLKTM